MYAYVANNPLSRIDPDGRIPIDALWDIGNLIYDAATGDWPSFAVDAVATAVPYVPAGVTKFLNPAKLADHHIFPQKYRKFFEKCGINIDEHTVTIG